MSYSTFFNGLTTITSDIKLHLKYELANKNKPKDQPERATNVLNTIPNYLIVNSGTNPINTHIKSYRAAISLKNKGRCYKNFTLVSIRQGKIYPQGTFLL